MYIYRTDFTKSFPDNQLTTLSSQHVNTAYTTSCREHTEIIIYRKEEWFKVFIHETFHNFGLDFSEMNLSHINTKMKKIFNINTEYNIYESYCETWARIINTMFYTYYQLLPKFRGDTKDFVAIFYKNINYEISFSLYQAIKILRFMGLHYDIINDKTDENITACNHLYKENTSVFSYYIVTAILLHNYMDFVHWCNANNNKLLKFKITPDNIDSYIQLIKKSNNKRLLSNINTIYKFFKSSNNINSNNTLQMSLLDLDNLSIVL